jgi:hypothetical protein
MGPKSALFLSSVIFAASLNVRAVVAQDDKGVPSPLEVNVESAPGIGGDCKAGSGAVAQLRYNGTQPLRGYLVQLFFIDAATGKTVQRQTLEESRDTREPMIAPGTEWTRTLCVSPKKSSDNAMKVTASVDVLKFADNSVWGPMDLRESNQLVGRLDGIDFMAKPTRLERFVSPILPQQGPLPVSQVETTRIGPLKIESGVWLNEKGEEMLAVAVTNEGEAPVRAYLLRTRFFDPVTGALIRRFTTKQLETHGNPADYLAPGSTWVADPRRFSYLADGTLASYAIDVDLVVFADGSMFGPKRSPESYEVLGMLQGIDQVRNSNQEASTKPAR